MKIGEFIPIHQFCQDLQVQLSESDGCRPKVLLDFYSTQCYMGYYPLLYVTDILIYFVGSWVIIFIFMSDALD